VDGARSAATPQPGFEEETVHEARDEISLSPGGGGGGAVGRTSWAFGSTHYISTCHSLQVVTVGKETKVSATVHRTTGSRDMLIS
jgi:hypothetical protein